MTVIKRIILNQENINSIFILDESLLEPSMLKGIRWVLRRGKESNLLVLSDYSIDNYIMGINEYNIVPIIFPKSSFKMSKLQGRMSTKLDIFKDKKTLNENKQLFLRLTTELYKNIGNWKKLKPIRGLIEDFFKVAKDAFGLGIFHSYTQKSMRKNIYLGYVKNFVGCTIIFTYYS